MILYDYLSAALAINVSKTNLRYAVDRGHVPGPSFQVGKRFFFTEKQIASLTAAFQAMPRIAAGHLSLTEIARRLKVSYKTLADLRDKGILPKSTKVGRRSYYAPADVASIKEVLAERRHKSWQSDLPKQGWYNQRAAARALGVPAITFCYHLHLGHIPKPTHLVGACLYYNEADLKQLKKWFKENWKPQK